MAAKLLIYHMEEVRRGAVEGLCGALGIEPVPVDDSSWGAPVGLLSGSADLRTLSQAAADTAGEAPGAGIDEEMIVMSGLSKEQFNALLDGLREMSLRVALKAVETPTNQSWSGRRLQAELKRERSAMEEMRRKRT